MPCRICLFCFCLFYVCLLVFVCLFDSFHWLVAFHYFLFTIIAGMARQYKSMQHMSNDWETVKTVSRKTVRHMT